MIATVTLNPALDKTIYLDRLLPNDTNRIAKIEIDAGGKGINASRVLHEIGTETIALGFLGGRTGRYIEHELNHEGIPTDFVWIAGETRTNVCVQEASGAPPTMLNEPGPCVTKDDLDRLLQTVRRAADKSEMIIFGGSPTRNVRKDIYRTLSESVRTYGARIILDSDGEPMQLGMEARPFMIKPNRDEVRRLVGVDIQSMDDAAGALERLRQTGIEVVVISMGARGAVAGSREGSWTSTPATWQS